MKIDTVRATVTMDPAMKALGLIVALLSHHYGDRTKILRMALMWAGWTQSESGWWRP